MNKSVILILLGVLTVVFAESSLKRDKDTLIKALKEKFDQYKKQQQSQNKLQENSKSDNQPLTTPGHNEQHDKAANAIGLALLDVSKPKSKEEKKTEKVEDKEDNDDDEMPDDNNDDEDNLNVELSTKKNDQSHKKTADKPGKNLEASDHSKKAETEKENQKDISVVKVDEDEKKTNSDGEGKQAEDKVAKEDKDKDNDEDEDEDSDKDDDDKSSKDSDKEEGKKSKKKLKEAEKDLKESAKRLKDKKDQAVNVGQLKKLLAKSVENLDKAGRAIHNLLQYDQKRKAHSRNSQVAPQPYQGYPQQGYGGYSQQQSPDQTTCPGQCSNLCAPTCRDPCCRFPPGIGTNPSPPFQARGSYQQGLINAYPPMTQLGGSQPNYQNPGMVQGMGQQCGQQCTPQSCAPSCSPSCCSAGGQANPQCPTSCLNNCAPACHARCCVPGRK